MSKSFDLRMSGMERGDCTASYSVTLHKKDYTVREFIEDILKEREDEWGYIGIHGKEFISVFGYPSCQYSYGKLTTETLPESFLNRKIQYVSANGGWTRMDYLITLVEEPNIEESITVTSHKNKKLKITLKPLDKKEEG